MKNKLRFLIAFTLLFIGFAHAQVGIGTNNPDVSAVLDVSSTTKGFLLPRLTTVQRDLITTPAKGLVIFNITTNQPEINTGTPLVPVWSILGGAPTLNITALQTGNYTANVTDDLIQSNINIPNLIVTLPTSGIPAGKIFYITNKGTKDWVINPTPATTGIAVAGAGIGVTLIWTGTEYVSFTGY